MNARTPHDPSDSTLPAEGEADRPQELGGAATSAAATQGERWDAIVIGSGMGGLAAANLLARLRGWRVLVLEQHFTVGGLTHEFRRGRFEFDVGLHYVGEMEAGSQAAAVMGFLSGGKLKWQRMPEEFECFSYPGLELRVPSDAVEYERRLAVRFPAEASALRAYFGDLKRAASGFVLAHLEDTLPRWMRPVYRLAVRGRTRLAGEVTQAYLARRFRDDRLRALLCSQWADYGLPPSESLFGIHALIADHYLHGAWYPVGGAKAIARHVLPAILERGGKALGGRRVKEILIENGRAVGVRVGRTYRPDLPETVYRAPVIVSDAGAYNTYARLLPPAQGVPFREQLAAAPPGYSAVSLYVGFKESPAQLGVQGENFWIFDAFDHDRVRTAEVPSGSVYLSFPSLKNPEARSHTAEIIALLPYAAFARWRGQPWKGRDAAYYKLKEEIAGTLLKQVEARLPGFTALVEFQELSTPLTMEHFQQGRRGEFYGMPARPGRLFAPWTHARTPVPGLFLTGQDVLSLGIYGAAMGGVKAAGAVLGPFGFFRIMGRIFRGAKAGRRVPAS